MMTVWLLLINTWVWVYVVLLWRKYGVWHLASPTVLYLAFHFLSFVVRPWALWSNEDFSFLHNHVRIWPSQADLTRALIVANVGLFAWIGGALVGLWRSQKVRVGHGRILNDTILRVIGGALLLAGIVSYWLYAPKQWAGQRSENYQVVYSESGMATAVSSSSGYLTAFYWVVVTIFVIWICRWGFKWQFALFLTIWFFLLMSLGHARTTFLVGSLAVAFAVMARQNRRWPGWSAVIGLGVVLFAFSAGKHWLNALLISGPSAALAEIQAAFSRSSGGQGDFFINFDFLVAATHLIPEYAPYSEFQLMGRPFYFWIPRAIWSDKPVFDYAAAYIGNNVPGVNFTGFIVTLPGESYMAFGMVSLVFLMAVYGFTFNWLHSWSSRFPVETVQHILGIAVSVSMIQVFRDGFSSFPFYMMFYFGPAMVLLIADELLVPKESRPSRRLAGRARAVPLIGRPVDTGIVLSSGNSPQKRVGKGL